MSNENLFGKVKTGVFILVIIIIMMYILTPGLYEKYILMNIPMYRLNCVKSMRFKDKKLNISKVENIKADENNIDEIGSPLQGLLYKVLVKKGQEIKENDPLFIIEAMKMETTVTAIRDGKVKSIMLKEGEMIMQDDLILSVE